MRNFLGRTYGFFAAAVSSVSSRLSVAIAAVLSVVFGSQSAYAQATVTEIVPEATFTDLIDGVATGLAGPVGAVLAVAFGLLLLRVVVRLIFRYVRA